MQKIGLSKHLLIPPSPTSLSDPRSKFRSVRLFDLALEVLACHQVGNVVLLVVLLLTILTGLDLHVLVALGELAEGGEGVGAELVENTGDELGKLLVFTLAVDGEGVCGNGGMN